MRFFYHDIPETLSTVCPPNLYLPPLMSCGPAKSLIWVIQDHGVRQLTFTLLLISMGSQALEGKSKSRGLSKEREQKKESQDWKGFWSQDHGCFCKGEKGQKGRELRYGLRPKLWQYGRIPQSSYWMDYKKENDKESEEERDKTDAIKAMKLTRNSSLAAREEAAFVCANLFFLLSRNKNKGNYR